MEKRYSLCPNCDNCPEVVITDECVCIGEDDNTARLSHSEWNELVAAVRRGDLTGVDVEDGSYPAHRRGIAGVRRLG